MGRVLSPRQAKKNNKYYNEDGTLSDAGKKKYAITEKQARALLKLEKENPREFYNVVNSLDAPVWYSSKNKEESMNLIDARLNKAKVSEEINKKANEIAEKQTGIKAKDLLNSKKVTPEMIDKYMQAGIEYAKSKEATDMMRKAMKQVKDSEVVYENKTREFVEGWLGEYGNLPSNNPLSVSVDLSTGNVKQQTLADRVTYEIYRKAGGTPH